MRFERNKYSYLILIARQKNNSMEELTLTTPALLFSAISLIMLAYTNRFLAYAAVVRNLHDKYLETMDDTLIDQNKNLTLRLNHVLNLHRYSRTRRMDLRCGIAPSDYLTWITD